MVLCGSSKIRTLSGTPGHDGMERFLVWPGTKIDGFCLPKAGCLKRNIAIPIGMHTIALQQLFEGPAESAKKDNIFGAQFVKIVVE